MAKLIRTIAAVLNAPVDPEELRYSRGMGPRPAPQSRRR